MDAQQVRMTRRPLLRPFHCVAGKIRTTTQVQTKGRTTIRKKAKAARATVCDSWKARFEVAFPHPEPLCRFPNSCPDLRFTNL